MKSHVLQPEIFVYLFVSVFFFLFCFLLCFNGLLAVILHHKLHAVSNLIKQNSRQEKKDFNGIPTGTCIPI